MPSPSTSPSPGSPRPAPLAVMLSGAGRTLVNLLDHIDRGALSARIVLVLASRECPGMRIAVERGLRTVVEPGDLPASVLGRHLDEAGAQFVAMAGYLRRIEIPAGFANRILNIHPALLPSFGGLGMYGDRIHQAVLDAGCKVSGCTVHLVDEEYDRGPILLQRCCPVFVDDDAQSLAARVFALEQQAFPEGLELLIRGRVRVEGRRARVLPD